MLTNVKLALIDGEDVESLSMSADISHTLIYSVNVFLVGYQLFKFSKLMLQMLCRQFRNRHLSVRSNMYLLLFYLLLNGGAKGLNTSL